MRKYFKPIRHFGTVDGCILAAVLMLAAGCGTVESPYIPSRIGPCPASPPQAPIEVLITSSQDTVTHGDPIYFTVVIRNNGPAPIWLPRNPDVVLTWIYPDGRHDNFLRDFPNERYLSESEALLLQPGQQMLRTVAVKTYYFPRPGITEFRAVLHSPRNTNAGLQPFWSGRIESNSFGIRVLHPKKKKAYLEAPRSYSVFWPRYV